MVVKHCVYRDCESDSRYWEREYMKGVCFIRFPNPLTNRERCEKWVKACDRLDFTIDKVNDKTYICSKHFVGGNGPTKTSVDPLPPNQLFEANLKNKMINNSDQNNINKCLNENSFDNISSDYNRVYFNNNSQDLKLREIELFKRNNICDQNQSLVNKNNSLISVNQLNEETTDSRVINEDNTNNKSSIFLINKLKEEPDVIDIQSDDSLKDSDECPTANGLITDSVLIPSIGSNTTVDNSSHILLSEVSNNNNINRTAITSNSLPFLIIPTTNQTMISSTFSAPVLPIDDKHWLNNFINNKFCLQLSRHGLSVGRVGERFTFSSISGCVVDKQLIIDISGNFDVKVFGVSLCAKNNFYKSVPIFIKNESQFNSVINNFCSWKVCVANEITDRVFEDKIIAIRAFICNISNTIRSRSCELLIPENGSIRCKACKVLLNRIRRFKYSLIKDIKTDQTN